MRPAWVEVDLDAIRHNVRAVRRHIGESSRVMAIVKANAYGHGAVEVANAALRGGAAMLGVAILDEAAALRDAGITSRILILGPILPENAEEAIGLGVEQAVSNREVARALSQAATRLEEPARVHVKVDTGMGRVGVSPAELCGFVEELSALPGIEIAGLFTHYATADDEPNFARLQLERFQCARAELLARGFSLPMCHTANSGAIAFLRESHFDMVRLGLSLYGIPPNPSPLEEIDLLPALSLKARITQLREMPAEVSISYGRTYTTERPERIAVVPLGYADGYSRALSNKGQVLVGGRRVPIRGRICMDQFLVDVSQVPDARLGDEVVLVGRQGEEEITAWEAAMWRDTIPYEVTSALTARVPRVYLGGE